MKKFKTNGEKTNKTVMLSASYAQSLINFRSHFIQKLVSIPAEVIVVAPDINQELKHNLENLGCIVEAVKLERNSISICADILYVFKLISLLIKHKPSLLISYTAKPNIFGAVAAKLVGIRSVSLVTGLGTGFVYKNASVRSLIIKYLYSFAFYLNKIIIFQNPDDVSDLAKFGIKSHVSKSHMVNGSGVDINFFKKEPFPIEFNFLMLSRLIESKGVLEFLEAAKIIKQMGYCVSFTLAGPDEYGHDSLDRKELLAKYNEYVDIQKEVADVRNLIKKSSVYVLPSYREGTPRSVLEAMSMGRPIITTDAPGCRETVSNNENGFLVKARSVDDLVRALEIYCKNPTLIEDMGASSHRLVKEKFEINFVTNQYFNHIKGLL